MIDDMFALVFAGAAVGFIAGFGFGVIAMYVIESCTNPVCPPAPPDPLQVLQQVKNAAPS